MTAGTTADPAGPSSGGGRSDDARPGTGRTLARVVSVVVALALLAGVGVTVQRWRLIGVDTPSMQPVISPGDRFAVDTRHREAALGDVVVVDAPAWTPEGGTTLVVKRVVATAGQHVVCCDDAGRVLVDDVPLPGRVGAPQVTKPGGVRVAGGAPFDVRVPAGRVFLMGDDRPLSVDSRAYADGPDGGTLPVADVVGRVGFRLWPLSAFGPMDTAFRG